ncbi:MAG: C25 family cysteine peptidase [Salinibacter sp.]
MLSRILILFAAAALLGGPDARGQSGGYDASWYDPDAPHLQIAVTADGVYRVDAASLREALPDGTALSDLSPASIRLLENGREVPIQLQGTSDGTLDAGDTITFVGRRNRGTDELWAYNGNASAQSSAYHSLYSDTTYYWMTWGGPDGRRYEAQASTGGSATTTALRDTVHAERDRRYYFGRPDENGNALYTPSEGYYWRRFSHNDTSPIAFTHPLPVGRRTDTSAEQLTLTVRLDAATNSCHRVELEGRLRSGGSTAYTTLQTTEWRGIRRQTVTASVDQDRIPDGGLALRLTSYNSGFSQSDCPDPSSTPNYVLLDWIEGAYTRTLTARNGRQRFVAPTTSTETFGLSGYAADTVHVYNPRDGRRFEAAVSGGVATVTDAPGRAPAPYWAVGPGGFRTPAAVLPDAPSDWSAASNSADYLILTTEALRPSAQKLAAYRESHDGYDVEIALVENVFDEFDYGRPTPIAIRRFVRATQDWDVAPRFLTIFADAQYPIRDGSVPTLYPEWSVPSFGYSPSDGWFAMQTDGPTDWSEVLAVGRIPVRSVAQGNLFVEKLKTYEQAPLKRWQKRMLLLAGGTTENEQNDLQDYSNWWGEIAADTAASTPGYTGPAYTGMDTLRYYKNVTDALDASFQDSLAVDLKQGAGWLSYFGHSAAQTWEIVTDPPSEFDNAGRLPIVVSLGCRTGSFAGGRFEEKSAPSLGEQLVVGSVRPDGTPRQGARNGGIAHFGESALGNLIPSARINDALIRQVFVDTSRVLGTAIQRAKAEIAAEYGRSDFYVKHLLQYGLLGDPATNMALPDAPDLHVGSDLVSVDPLAPTPSEELTVSVEVQSRGLIPSDSVTVRLTWQRPDGTTTRRTRRVERFPLERTLTFAFTPGADAIGTNTFRVQVDPGDEYAEITETDNAARAEQVIFRSGVSLVAPVDFGVTSELPRLTFSVSRQTQEPISVIAQLDTVPDFSSPARREIRTTVDGVQGTWRPPALEPNTTYYWRARTAEASEDAWTTARFTVDPSLPEATWLQTGRLFSANANRRLERSGRAWSFGQFARNVSAMSERGGGSRPDGFVLDGASDYEYLAFGFGVLVMNGTTGRVRDSESFPTYSLADRFEREYSDVGDQQEAIDSLTVFLDEVARRGDYVFVRTRHLARESSATIPAEVKSLFKNLGSTSTTGRPYSQAIDTLTYRDLWTLKARKGYPDATVERVSPASEASEVNEIIQESRLSFSRPSGTTITPRIGPASQWNALAWTGQTESSDAVRVDVLAADSTVLIEDLSSASGQRALDQIDAQTHPYLRLRATLSDSTTRTAPQLERWRVSYRGVPELAVDPAGLRSIPDTLQQGETAVAALPVVNLGPVASGPVRVRYTVTGASNATTTLSADTLRALSQNGRDTSSVRFASGNFPGRNALSAAADAEGPPERLASNNVAVRSVFVQRDQTPPSVRVLNNGRELPETSASVNNLQAPSLPFVSTEPSFEIIVEDDSSQLAPDDTSQAAVYLKGGLPSRGPSLVSGFRRIPFSSSRLELVPSDSASGTMRLLFEPRLRAQDSTYTVKVEAQDARGNEIEPYQVSFRVQKDQVIRDVYPYPNPMSTHTTFAFRVEGGRDEMLKDFALRIYTLSGRLVRELTRADLEQPLGVGWNTVRWNGRDADGDRVATGVYLYRVRVEGTDQTFRGDVEKVTVIR